MVDEATKFGVGAASIGSGALGGMAGAEETEASKAYDQAKGLLQGNKGAELAEAERKEDLNRIMEFIRSKGQSGGKDGDKHWDTPEDIRKDVELVFGTPKAPGPSTSKDGPSSSTLKRRSLEARGLQKRSPPSSFSYVSLYL